MLGSALAQSPPVGVIEGRVFNPGTGEYLELVRITVEGTSLEAFTDTSGQYRIGNVPAGQARVRAFRTGIVPQTHPVTVIGGETTQRDFDLSGLPAKPGAEGVNRGEPEA